MICVKGWGLEVWLGMALGLGFMVWDTVSVSKVLESGKVYGYG